MKFKDRLRELRINFYKDGKRLTQAELAKKLSYGYTTISNYESGRSEPALKDLIILADFFQVPMDYLLGRSDNRREASAENREDQELLMLFRAMNPDRRDQVLSLLRKEIRDNY